MVHADLDHRDAGIFGHTRQSKRDAPMVVVAGLGGVELSLPPKCHAQHFLGGGFADRACDADHAGICAGTGGAAQIRKCTQYIGDDKQRRIRGDTFGDTRDESGGGTFFEGDCNEIMAIANIFERHEKIAGL